MVIDVVRYVENFGFNKVNEEVNRVGMITCSFISSHMLNGIAYDPQERIGFV